VSEEGEVLCIIVALKPFFSRALPEKRIEIAILRRLFTILPALQK